MIFLALLSHFLKRTKNSHMKENRKEEFVYDYRCTVKKNVKLASKKKFKCCFLDSFLKKSSQYIENMIKKCVLNFFPFS